MLRTALVAAALPALFLVPIQSDDGATCQTYDPLHLQSVQGNFNFTATASWRIETAGQPLEQAANLAEADEVVALALFYTTECRLVSKEPAAYPTVTYWKNPTKPLAVPFKENCRTYTPTLMSRTATEVGDLRLPPKPATGQPVPMPLKFQVAGEPEAIRLLAVMHAARQACVIGGWAPEVTPDLEAQAALSAEGQKALADVQHAWHPVYYWKK
jgi:hypothetical protein